MPQAACCQSAQDPKRTPIHTPNQWLAAPICAGAPRRLTLMRWIGRYNNFSQYSAIGGQSLDDAINVAGLADTEKAKLAA